VWQFYTIRDKNQLLKVKIEKVTVILVLRSAACQLQVSYRSAAGDIALRAEVCMGLYGGFSKNQSSVTLARRPATVIRQDVVY
jgi:hypothetical protein